MIIQEEERESCGWGYIQLRFDFVEVKKMAQNTGKVFEKDFADSIPGKYFKYKLKDSGASWQGGEKARFTPTNICDYIVHDGQWLFLLELKSHKGASLPIAPKINDKGKITHYGVIKANQLNGLMDNHDKANLEAGFIINLSEKFKTFFVEVVNVNSAISEGKKSLSLEWLECNGMLIPQETKKRGTHQVYDLSVLLD